MMSHRSNGSSGRPRARKCGAWVVAAISAICALIVLTPATVSAQTINPTRLTWTHALADYSQAARYEAGWYLSDSAPSPVQVADLGKPDLVACAASGATVVCTVPIPARPALGSWVIRVQAIGQTQQGVDAPSGWSAPSDPFLVSLSAPSAVSALP